MSAAQPYVTVGDTPTCTACKSYYSERYCEDCAQSLCTWCNIDLHVPIGKRNHYRPRLYGVDQYAHLDAPAISTADAAFGEGKDGAAGGTSTDANASDTQHKFTFDPVTSRVNVTTEHFFHLSAEEAWDLLGDFTSHAVPREYMHVLRDGEEEDDENSHNEDRRYLALPSPLDPEQQVVVTERLIQRDDREMFYSYSRLVPPEAGFAFDSLMSKFAFIGLSKGGSGADSAREKRCMLQWTTSVLPVDTKNPKEAADAVAKFQESWQPYFEATIEMED